MGTYLTVEIIDKNKKRITSLGTNKGSLGTFAYAFDQESLHFTKGSELYNLMPVEKAIKNLKEVLSDIKENLIPEKLDEWSKMSIRNRWDNIQNAIHKLSNYEDKELYLYCNEIEYMWIYEKDDEKVPSSERERHWKNFRNLAKGLDYGKHLTPEQREVQEIEKKNLMSFLESQDWISKVEHFGSIYDVHHIVMGNSIVNRFSCTIHSELLKCEYDIYELLTNERDFVSKLKELVLPLDIGLDENISSKYNHSRYKYIQGLQKMLEEKGIDCKDLFWDYQQSHSISSYDHEEGLVFMEFYSPFNNVKLQQPLIVNS